MLIKGFKEETESGFFGLSRRRENQTFYKLQGRHILKHEEKLQRKTLKKTKRTISRYGMLKQGDSVVVAVSGGPDSVCLLDVLNELKDDLGIELVVAHFDHGLRPDEDGNETRFVKALAASYGLPFDAGRQASENPEKIKFSLEEKARDARYRYLEETRQNYSSNKIATGHNLNDQAETILMRLLRGSGTSGLAGIPPLRDGVIIRPLIEITRNKIIRYLDSKGASYCTDSSNLEPHCMRNKIRLDLLPRIEEYQPRIVEILGKTAGIMRADNDRLEEEVKEWAKANVETFDNREVRIALPSLMKLPEALINRTIRLALKTAGGNLRRVNLKHIKAVTHMAMGNRPQARINLPNQVVAERAYEKLIFTVNRDKKYENFSYTLDSPGTYRLEIPGYDVLVEEVKKHTLYHKEDSRWTAYLNADSLAYPLTIRNFRPGDRFIPFGMSGHKKLKDFFIDLKIPSEKRSRIPVLTFKNAIIWVCGLRIDDRFKVTRDVEKVLKVTLKRTHSIHSRPPSSA